MTALGQFAEGGLGFFPCSRNSWLLGKIESTHDNGHIQIVHATEEGEVAQIDDEELRETLHTDKLAPVIEGSLDEVTDLIDMPVLHEAVLLHHIRRRYWDDMVFTNIGPIVLAVNPYNFNIPHYMDEHMVRYIEEKETALNSGSEQITHIWSVAHDAYWNMRVNAKPQSILVSGESGAGKTEAAKIVAKYLAKVSTHFSPPEAREAALAVTRKVVATSPILEAFGNAKTVRNDNSSRFGKFMKIRFDANGMLVGSFTKHYLLEKSRIVTHAKNERSYHAYYQLVLGASNPWDRERLQLDHPRIQWIYEGSARDESNAAEYDEFHEDKKNYEEVLKAMNVIGLTESEQRGVYDLIAGIMHFQGIKIEENDDGVAKFVDDDDDEAVKLTATLWGVDAEVLKSEILTTTNTIRGEKVVKKLNQAQATAMRDALSKTSYEGLFTWLIDRINSILVTDEMREELEREAARDGESSPKADGDNWNYWIGLLDIFGFENFQENSLEQYLINLANEQLQNHYNSCVFERDLVEYQEEGIDTSSVQPPDNSTTLQLLRGKGSVIDLLNDACKNQSATDETFLNQTCETFGARPGDKSHKPHPAFLKKKILDGTFGIRHYAADVWYNVDGFKEKNLDTLKNSMKQLMADSSSELISILLPRPEDENSPAPSPKSAGKGSRVKTTALNFRSSLDDLLRLINMTHPHWIRCIKPHSAKKPRMFHGIEVMDQLRCAGVLETIKIRQTGYSMRIPHEAFFKRFSLLLPDPNVDALEGCKQLLAMALTDDDTEAQIGKTKVFLKDPPYKVLEDKRDGVLSKSGVVVQAFARTRASVQRRNNLLLQRKVLDIQRFAREKVALQVRAEKDLLRMVRLVQGVARTKLSSHRRYYLKLNDSANTIAAFAASRAAEQDLRQKEFERWRFLSSCATTIQMHLRYHVSGAIVRTRHGNIVADLKRKIKEKGDYKFQVEKLCKLLAEAEEETDAAKAAAAAAEEQLEARGGELQAMGQQLEAAQAAQTAAEEAAEQARAAAETAVAEAEASAQQAAEAMAKAPAAPKAPASAPASGASSAEVQKLNEEIHTLREQLRTAQASCAAAAPAAAAPPPALSAPPTLSAPPASAALNAEQQRRINAQDDEIRALRDQLKAAHEAKESKAKSMLRQIARPKKVQTSAAPPDREAENSQLREELEMRKEQLEKLATQLSQVVTEQMDLQQRVEQEMSQKKTFMMELDEERKRREKLEDRASRLQDVVDGNNARKQSAVDGNVSDPAVLEKLVAAAKATLFDAKQGVEAQETEYINLEKRLQLCQPLETPEFYEMVATQAEDLVNKTRKGEIEKLNSSTSSFSSLTLRDGTVADLIARIKAVAAEHGPHLPQGVFEDIKTLLKEVDSQVMQVDNSAGMLGTMCLNQAQTEQVIGPLLDVLKSCAGTEAELQSQRQPLQIIQAALGNYNGMARSGGKPDWVKVKRVAGQLEAAREGISQRLASLKTHEQSGVELAERVKGLRNEHSKIRGSLRGHRSERDDAMARAKQLTMEMEAYESKMRILFQQEIESEEDIRTRIQDLRSRVAAKQKEVEKDKLKLFDLESTHAQHQRQHAQHSEVLVGVRKRVELEKVECDRQESALQIAALLKVKQLGFMDSSEEPLLAQTEKHLEQTKAFRTALLQEQMAVVQAEWALCKTLQQQEAANFERHNDTLERESNVLEHLESNAAQSPTKFLDKMKMGLSSPGTAFAKQKKAIEAVSQQCQQSREELERLRTVLNTIKSTVVEFANDQAADYDLDSVAWPEGLDQ
eukprot:TRINITY_DN4130_c0_g5_i1.p1 TRINITY_DN4130_c0_g5~~TRINITY_DN4130_c0_g5_i1.p1  ORF type:complete len:1777 (+),score=722.34 TRINITY_DN4130_c0_g5_i1:106-5436(+)